MCDDDFRKLRRYTRPEVAKLLNVSDSWLKKQVSKETVPFQKTGEVRGVWFTYDDVCAIGQLLPTLMSTRSPAPVMGPAAQEAAADAVGDADAASAAGVVEPDDVFAWLDLQPARRAAPRSQVIQKFAP